MIQLKRDIAANAINSGKIEDGTITYSDIKDNTISADDITNNLIFGDGDLIDLSDVDHSSTDVMGLVLPGVSSASPSSPSSGEGYLAYDTAGDQVIFYNGSSWAQIGGGVSLYSDSGETGTTSSVSGLELINSDEISLIRGCSDSQLLKWNDTAKTWICADDTGGAGSGISTVRESMDLLQSGH